MNICILQDCYNQHKAKGYCSKHYQTFMKYRNPCHKEKRGQPPKFKSLKHNFESRFIKDNSK